jgi:toxin ParE1/3/4
MVFDIVIKPIVFLDVEEAVIFYAKKSNKLGGRFYKNFLQSIEDIRLSPENYSYIHKPVRRHIIKKFPYKVYYIVLNEAIVIIGVAHVKRSNSYIKSKLKNR